MDFKFQLVFLGVFLTLCFGEIVQEGEIIEDNGDVIPVALETDNNCSYRRYSSVYGDKVNVIVDDISNGISIVLMSENPDICYVWTLTAEEKAKEGKCDKGTLQGQQAEPSQEKKQFSIGEEIDFGTLPSRAQELCQGRKALALEEQPKDVPDVKRACRMYLVTGFKRDCKYVCRGWWAGKRCRTECIDYKVTYWKVVC